MDVLLIFACFYFAYNCVNAVLKSEQPWGWGQYLSLVVALALAVLGILRLIAYCRTYKDRQAKKQEKQEEEMRKLQEQRRRVYLYDEEGYTEAEPVPAAESAEEDDFLDQLFEKQAMELAEAGQEIPRDGFIAKQQQDEAQDAPAESEPAEEENEDETER